MPYKFTFDLSRLQRSIFTEVARIGYQTGMHRKVGKTAQDVIRKFKIQESTGLDLSDAVVLMQDFIDLQARNIMERNNFQQTHKRALFLPHCSRKYLDNRCHASFDPKIPSYRCGHCSPDCLINRTIAYAEKKGYDVYVLPGGSCIPKILRAGGYEGAVGVACGEETKVSGDLLKDMGVACQAVPLIKNGCANTIFNLDTLYNVL